MKYEVMVRKGSKVRTIILKADSLKDATRIANIKVKGAVLSIERLPSIGEILSNCICEEGEWI